MEPPRQSTGKRIRFYGAGKCPCDLKPGEAKGLPTFAPMPLIYVIACPSCGYRETFNADDQKLENPRGEDINMSPGFRCSHCKRFWELRSGEFFEVDL